MKQWRYYISSYEIFGRRPFQKTHNYLKITKQTSYDKISLYHKTMCKFENTYPIHNSNLYRQDEEGHAESNHIIIEMEFTYYKLDPSEMCNSLLLLGFFFLKYSQRTIHHKHYKILEHFQILYSMVFTPYSFLLPALGNNLSTFCLHHIII